jgi:hypothetical protein
MNLSQLLARVATGAAGGLAICGASSGTIPGEHLPRVIGKVQDTLTELHKRFPLQVKVLTLAVVDGVFAYPLREEFAQSSGSTEINKFILDSEAQPYTGDLLAIEHVLDATDNSELPLNDRRNPLSWFTVAYDTLSMNYPVTGEQYFVQYRADHAPLDIATHVVGIPDNPDDPIRTELTPTAAAQKISIPASLFEAFMAKLAYELYCTQDGDGAMAKTNMLLQQYEAACLELEGRNTLNSSEITDRTDMITAGGWA